MNPKKHQISFSTERIESGTGEVVALKLQYGNHFELNIRISSKEIPKLREIASTDWVNRKTLKIGESLGAAVFWCVDGDHISILIGEDDESWEVGAFIPLELLSQLATECERKQN